MTYELAADSDTDGETSSGFVHVCNRSERRATYMDDVLDSGRTARSTSAHAYIQQHGLGEHVRCIASVRTVLAINMNSKL